MNFPAEGSGCGEGETRVADRALGRAARTSDLSHSENGEGGFTRPRALGGSKSLRARRVRRIKFIIRLTRARE